MPLTDAACRNAKPTGKPVKLADGGGLYLYVSPRGGKLWRCDYRHLGKRRTASLGPYPVLGLADARKRRDDLKRQILDGIDPAAAKRESVRTAKMAAGMTFGLIADEYVAKHRREGHAATTVAKLEWLLGMAKDEIGNRPIADIKAPEVLAALRKVEVRGRHETARRMRSSISRVFRYAVATARAESDPTSALAGALTAPVTVSRAAVTDPTALGALLRAIEGYAGQPTTHAALRLIPMLFTRPGELRAAEWSEIELDKALWIIPATRMKMRREHRVPLPRQAVAILRGLHRVTGKGKLVFPCLRTVLRPISENTMNSALRRLGYDKTEVSPHGFRATASTLLNESGTWNPDAIERQLAHVEANDVRRAYARGEHWDERVRMMQWWADYLDGLRENARP